AAVVCFGAIVWYTYSWGTGQVTSDEFPVVRAEPMPEKVRPEQPGGLDVPHQGIAVLNNDGDQTPQVGERLLPRPEIPAPPEPLTEQSANALAIEEAAQLPPEGALLDGGSGADLTEAPDLSVDEAPVPSQSTEQGFAAPLPKPAADRDQIA